MKRQKCLNLLNILYYYVQWYIVSSNIRNISFLLLQPHQTDRRMILNVFHKKNKWKALGPNDKNRLFVAGQKHLALLFDSKSRNLKGNYDNYL